MKLTSKQRLQLRDILTNIDNGTTTPLQALYDVSDKLRLGTFHYEFINAIDEPTPLDKISSEQVKHIINDIIIEGGIAQCF